MAHDDRSNDIYIEILDKPSMNIDFASSETLNIDIDQSRSGYTTNYNVLANKPQINNIELIGNKSSKQLGLQDTLDMAEKHDIDDILYGID